MRAMLLAFGSMLVGCSGEVTVVSCDKITSVEGFGICEDYHVSSTSEADATYAECSQSHGIAARGGTCSQHGGGGCRVALSSSPKSYGVKWLLQKQPDEVKQYCANMNSMYVAP